MNENEVLVLLHPGKYGEDDTYFVLVRPRNSKLWKRSTSGQYVGWRVDSTYTVWRDADMRREFLERIQA